jgi:hypothetical protein
MNRAFISQMGWNCTDEISCNVSKSRRGNTKFALPETQLLMLKLVEKRLNPRKHPSLSKILNQTDGLLV